MTITTARHGARRPTRDMPADRALLPRGRTISEAERFRDLLDKRITEARSMSDGEENMRRFRN
jgi:hypothetical protein